LALVFVTVHLSLPFTPNICGHSLIRFTYFSAVTQIAHLLAGPGIFTAVFAFEKLAHDLPGRVQRRFSSREISELRPTAVTQLAQAVLQPMNQWSALRFAVYGALGRSDALFGIVGECD